MSLIINNELIWVSIPKCGTASIKKGLMESNLKITHFPIKDISLGHTAVHIRRSDLLEFFGRKETFTITRDWFDRWMSALQFFFDASNDFHKNETKIRYEDIDNDFIMKNFDHEFANVIYGDDPYLMGKEYDKFFNNINKRLVGTLDIFKSAKYYTDNEKCTYEFDLGDMDLFRGFIYDKFNERIKLDRLNSNIKKETKIQINDDLKNWIYDVFESRYHQKNGKLI